ncbi:hypothetical protein A9Q99_26555 [Gammaproteobacteria bacterium 45_16_T64]|nr:hypothetical protein A9Q99_26555 [Gammaproteobacteria bacterium 45_16_T64]
MTYNSDRLPAELSAFSHGETIITPNQRIATWLLSLFKDKKLRTSDTSAWQTPKIMALSSWLDETYESAQDSACVNPHFDAIPDLARLRFKLLSPAQEKVVWESIISDQENDWIKPDGAAKQAIQAWSILNRWAAVKDNERQDVNENTHLFQGWLNQFSQRCFSNKWVSNAERVELLELCIKHQLVSFPGSLFFYGFSDLEPAIQRLAVSVSEAGGDFRVLPFGEETENVVCRSYPDKTIELEAAIAWLVEANQSDPGGRYCVVAPDIGDERASIERICKRLIQKDSNTQPDLNDWRDQVNVSAGSPLGAFGVVSDALLMLSAANGQLSRDDWGIIVRGPYWSESYVSFSLCSQFSDVIAQSKNERLSAEKVYTLYRVWRGRTADNSDNTSDPLGGLLECLSSIRLDAKRTYSAWSIEIKQLLETISWPGKRTLTSQDYQLREKFFEQIALLDGYDEVLERTSFRGVLSTLKTTLQETMFQIQTEQAPMQILGVLEASAMTFDGIWVLSSDDQHWPESPAPNPFLCPKYQRDMGMPNASAEKELGYAEFILGGFLKTSPSVVFSWHLLKGDTELNISPVLERYRLEKQPTLIEGSVSQILNPFHLDIDEDCKVDFVDDIGPALEGGSKMKGGASLIKTQASCPFRAFALYRLGARSLEEKEEGLSPAERGDLLHMTLEKFWKVCTSLSQLQTLLNKREELEALIYRCVTDSLTFFKDKNAGVNEAFLKVEESRLISLVIYWLESVESKRTRFEVVSVEKSEIMQLGNIEVTVKADRIDRIEGDYTVIVDYKTGLKSRTAWEGNRPDDPQLPLYAVNHKGAVDGVLFGLVRKGESSLKGELDEAVQLLENGKNRSVVAIEDWPVHVDNWEKVLTQLAEDFSQGFAAVDPKNKKSCEFCELTPFCRRMEK